MRQGHRLSGTGARDHQQRSGLERRAVSLAAVGCCLPLRGIQHSQVVIVALGRQHRRIPENLYFYTVLDEFTRPGRRTPR